MSDDTARLQMRVSECVDIISTWIKANRSKLNREDKSDLVLVLLEPEKYLELFCTSKQHQFIESCEVIEKPNE